VSAPLANGQPRSAQPLIAAMSFFILFGFLAAAVQTGSADHADLIIRNIVHRFASPDLTRAMKVATYLGSVGVLSVFLGVSVVGFWVSGRPAAASLLAATMASAIVLENATKLAFRRPRPEPFFDIVVPQTFSFPSGHSLFSACFYGTLAYLLAAQVGKQTLRIAIWTSAAVIVGVIGFSRIYLGVHYPTDVLGGYLVAVFCLSAMKLWLRR
jgi:undecaprenyl-diphosphatase